MIAALKKTMSCADHLNPRSCDLLRHPAVDVDQISITAEAAFDKPHHQNLAYKKIGIWHQVCDNTTTVGSRCVDVSAVVNLFLTPVLCQCPIERTIINTRYRTEANRVWTLSLWPDDCELIHDIFLCFNSIYICTCNEWMFISNYQTAPHWMKWITKCRECRKGKQDTGKRLETQSSRWMAEQFSEIWTLVKRNEIKPWARQLLAGSPHVQKSSASPTI